MVHAPSEEARHAAVSHANQHERERSDEADEQGYPRALHQPGKHVPAEVIGAERVKSKFDMVANLVAVTTPHEPALGRFGERHGIDDIDLQVRAFADFSALGIERHNRIVIRLGAQIEQVLIPCDIGRTGGA